MRWLEYLIFLAIVLGLARPTGVYLARVFEGQRTWLDPVLRPLESLIYGILGVRPHREMSAGVYFFSFVLFSLLGAVGLFALLMLQTALAGGPAEYGTENDPSSQFSEEIRLTSKGDERLNWKWSRPTRPIRSNWSARPGSTAADPERPG